MADRSANIYCTHLVPAGQKKLSLQTHRPIYVVPLVPAGQKNNYHCRPTGRHTTTVPFLNRPAGEIQIHGRPVGQHILYPPSTSWPEKIIAADRPANICCTHLVPAGQKRNYHCRPTGQYTIIVPFLNQPASEMQVHCRLVGRHILYPPSTGWPDKNYHCRPTSRYMLYPPSTGWPEKKLSLQTDRPTYYYCTLLELTGQ